MKDAFPTPTLQILICKGVFQPCRCQAESTHGSCQRVCASGKGPKAVGFQGSKRRAASKTSFTGTPAMAATPLQDSYSGDA